MPFRVSFSFALALLATGCLGAPAASPHTRARKHRHASADLAALSNEELARKSMDVTGALDRCQHLMDLVAENARKSDDLPPDFLHRFRANAKSGALVPLMLPIYLKQHDRKAMIETIRAYESKNELSRARRAAGADEIVTIGTALGRSLVEKTKAEMHDTEPAPYGPTE